MLQSVPARAVVLTLACKQIIAEVLINCLQTLPHAFALLAGFVLEALCLNVHVGLLRLLEGLLRGTLIMTGLSFD